MQRENDYDKKSRSRSRSKSNKKYSQHIQALNSTIQKYQQEGNSSQIGKKECISHNSSPIRLQGDLNMNEEQNNKLQGQLRESKEEYKILDHNVNQAPINQFQIQCENIDQSERCILTMPLSQKEKKDTTKKYLEKQPSQLITINDTSQEVDQEEYHQFNNSKKDSSRNSVLEQKLTKIQRLKIKRPSQDRNPFKSQKEQLECIDLTNDDCIQTFFGLNHPMFLSSMEYKKKELFELVEPYEYQCGNFMINLGVLGDYTAIVTLPSLSQNKSIYYLFMMFQFDQDNFYCMVPEDDQTTILISNNIQSIYYYCKKNNQTKKNNKLTFLESTLKYKFPYIYPTLIRKYIATYKINDQQIIYHINYDSQATQLAIEELYQTIPGHLITGTSHPILKILFLKSQNNLIPQFYYKFLNTPLYEGQFSLKANLQSNGKMIVIERRFLSPISYGIHQIKIEINRTTNYIEMKQVGEEQEIQSKSIQQFWNEVQQKYIKLYPSKLLYNYFVDLILQDRKIQEKYKKWNLLYDSMIKSQQQKPIKPNDKLFILNDKQFYCFSIEDVKNGNKIKQL